MIRPWLRLLTTGASRNRPGAILLALIVGLVTIACNSPPFIISATGPWGYSAVVEPPFERLAILVTITNRSEDDLIVNPADFVARDAGHRVDPANPIEAVSDASAARLTFATQRGVQAIVPLPTMTLRQ